MKWRYINASNSTEVAEHDAVSQRIDDWWAEFVAKTDRLDALFRQTEQWDLPAWMNESLQRIHPALMWEFGPAISKDGHRLVITPEICSEVRPLAEEVVARAPDLERWEFYTYRLPESVEQMLHTVQARIGLELTDVTVAVSAGEHNRIDLAFRWETIPEDDEEAFNAAFVATESLLGEESLDRWVGVIQLTDSSTPVEAGQRYLPMDRLHPTFNAVMNSIREQLPDDPYSNLDEDTQWALLKLEPTEAEDYPERSDMLTCVTCNPDLVGATFSEAPFYSERYSRCHETFCYLKIDGTDSDEMGFHDREDMEEAARMALEADESGGLVGGGTGLRYSYVEFALTNVKKGVAAIRRAMQQGNVPRRSWILFHDADLDAEWIGVYDDSPTPPMAERAERDPE